MNREISDERSLYRTDRERLEAGMMRNPFDSEKTFSYYGLMLGTFPPAAIFARWLVSVNFRDPAPIWVFGVLAIVILLSGTVGYFSGKLVGRQLRKVENLSWSTMLPASIFIGLMWGMVSGAAGGFVIFVIGAFFGAILGGMVGAVALPAFTIMHRLVKQGDLIEKKHFLPLAFGVTFTICSFILGF